MAKVRRLFDMDMDITQGERVGDSNLEKSDGVGIYLRKALQVNADMAQLRTDLYPGQTSEQVVFVNALQYRRILLRREARARMSRQGYTLKVMLRSCASGKNRLLSS